jgi:hypothetical protein
VWLIITNTFRREEEDRGREGKGRQGQECPCPSMDVS